MKQTIVVRPASIEDAEGWLSLRSQLFPSARREDLRHDISAYFQSMGLLKIVYLALHGPRYLGLIELSLRNYAEGTDISPVPYIEAWYVAHKYRRQGIGSALIKTVEDWAQTQGYPVLASDAQVTNMISETAHKKLGFVEVARNIHFLKKLAFASKR